MRVKPWELAKNQLEMMLRSNRMCPHLQTSQNYELCGVFLFLFYFIFIFFCFGFWWRNLKYFSPWRVFPSAGGGSEVAARALSLPDLQNPNLPSGLDRDERSAMEQEIGRISHMIDQMETKVNVLRWMVEPRGPQYAEPLSSTDSASLALLSVDEEQPGAQPLRQHTQIFVLFMLLAVVLLAATLSISVIFFSWVEPFQMSFFFFKSKGMQCAVRKVLVSPVQTLVFATVAVLSCLLQWI